jgi:hypothetical protein
VENQIVVHIKTSDSKIVVETPSSLTTLKLIGGQGSEIYLNGSDLSAITDIGCASGIKYALAPSSSDQKSAGSVILETQVTNILYKLGVPSNIKGCGYLREAIILAVNNPDIIYAVTKELYPAIAHIFDTTTSRVDRGIRYAIAVAWKHMDSAIMREYFRHRMYFSTVKPTNSEFIATISDRFLLGMNEEGKTPYLL